MQRIEAFAPYLLLAYMVGVGFMLARFSLSIIGSSRLRQTIQPITDVKLLRTIAEQCARIGLKRIPVVALCQRVSVPVVVGIVKPMILLPPALLCGLDPNQIAAILSHEIAHIRRYDLIFNLLQRIVEALLFFHPVTWWISRRVSIERENCCDDVAAACMGRLPYAGALLQMAELCIGNDRRRSAALATLSASGSNSTDLGYRIRRLINAEETTRTGVTRRGFAVGLSLLTLLMVSLVAWGQNGESLDEKSDDESLSKIFTPEPLWQTNVAANEVATEMTRISPMVVVSDRLLTIGKDFDLTTGKEIQNPFVRLPRSYEFEVTLDPVFRRRSSDHAFIVEASNRSPGKTWSMPSYDLRVLRARDGAQVGVTITVAGYFGWFDCDVDVENSGDFLLLGAGDEVRVYRTETGQVETTMPVKTRRVDAVAISPDLEWLVVSDQNDLHFWRWRDLASVKTIHAGRKIDSLAFTPDGQYLAEGPDSGEDIQIRDLRTLEVIASLKDEVGSPLMVSSMDITHDGRYLVAHNEVSIDQSKLTIPHRIHVWDLQSHGKPVFQIATGEWVRKVEFSDDGRMIVGEFSGAAHGALLAAWQLPNEIVQRPIDSPIDAKDRLGDGIQWSRFGDENGLLSGARLILPKDGLKPGQPLVVEYRLANVSKETKTLKCYLNKGMQFTSLSHGNWISCWGPDWQREPVTLTIEPGDTFIDAEHLVSIDTTGLEPGNYHVAPGSAFGYPDELEPNTTHEIPHRGSIRFTIVGESTLKISELPKSDIHWGSPIAGLQVGARFVGDPNAIAVGESVEADLFVANVTSQPIECSVAVPHISHGWLFSVMDSNGTAIKLDGPFPLIHSPYLERRVIPFTLAPGQVSPITAEGAPLRSRPSFATSRTTQRYLPWPSGTDLAGSTTWPKHNIYSLMTQGGAYSATFHVTLMRPELPNLRLELDSGNVPFSVKSRDENQDSSKQSFKLTDGETGKPLQGLKCRAIVAKQNTPPRYQECTTDEDGVVEVVVAKDESAWIAEVPSGWFSNGFGQMYVVAVPESEQRPQQNAEKENGEPKLLKLWRGTEVDGRLLWPDKTPAAGVKLTAGVYIYNQSWKEKLGMDLTHYSFDHGDWPNWCRTVVTDEDGKFRVTVPPKDARFWLRIGTTQLGFGPQINVGENEAITQRLATCVPLEVQYGGSSRNNTLIVHDIPETDNLVLHTGDLPLETGVIVRGRVVDAEGKGLANVRLTSTGQHGPHSGRSATSGEDGKFEFPAMAAGILTVHPDARLRDDTKAIPDQIVSRDVQAVFVDESFTIPSVFLPHEITVRAVPHTEVTFEWVDRRADKTQSIAYYGAFRVRGYMPDENGKPATYWTSETERVERDGKQWLMIKIPTQLLKPELMLVSDSKVTSSYSDSTGVTSGPGIVELGDVTANTTRTIFGDEPREPEDAQKEQNSKASSKAESKTRIEGIVLDSEKQPIAGVPLSFLAFAGDQVNAFKPIYLDTDNEGRFSVEIPSRTFRVYFSSPNEQHESLGELIVRDGQAVAPSDGIEARPTDGKISVVATLPHSYGLNIELIDDVSGQPIKDGAVLYKEDESTWSGDGESAYETDAFWEIFHTVERGETRQQAIVSRAHGLAHLIVIATGYEPVKTKLNEKLERSKSITQTIRMKPVAPIEMTIVQPDGAPASEATFESRDMKDFRHALRLDSSGVLRSLLAVKLKADERGVATFPRPAFGEWASYRIEHASGHVDLNIRDIPVSADRVSVSKHSVKLLGRVTIEGRYLPRVGKNEFLEICRLQPTRFSADGSPQRVEVDQDGRFSLPSQLAGWHSFSHRIETTDSKGNRGTSAIASYGPFELLPGEKRTLILGDDGSSVIGKLVLPQNEADDFSGLTIQAFGGGSFTYPHEPRGLDEQASLDWWTAYWASPAGRDHDEYGLRNRTIPVASDGSICFPLLPPGSYKLRAFREDQVVSLSLSELVIADDQRGTVIDLGDLIVEIEKPSSDPEHGDNHDRHHTKEPVNWIPARPQKTTVSSGSARIIDDHSVRLEGDVAWQEASLQFAFDKPTNVQEIRLEILPVDSPTGPQVGRGGQELMLLDVKPSIEDQTGKFTSLDFASCTYLQNPSDETAANCIDYLDDTGWKVPKLPAEASAHELVLRFEKPIALRADHPLTLTVDSGGAKELAVLNRIRFAFRHSAVAEPLSVNSTMNGSDPSALITTSGANEKVEPWEISKLYEAAFLRKYLMDHEVLPKPIVVPAVRGKVLDPNGKPATGVNLVSYTPRHGVTINPLNSGGVKRSKQDGTFGLPERTEPYRVLLTHESGVANVSHEELLRAHGVITLQKWASVTGTLKLDGKPQAGETIVLHFDPLPWSYSREKLTIIHRTTTDKDGNFSFDRVPPLGGIAHARALKGTVYQCESGKNTHIEIGVGRTVTGKLQLPEHIQKSKLQLYARNHLLPIPYPKDWTDQVTQAERDAWQIKWLQTAEGYEYADSNYVLGNSSVPGSIADDGKFTMYGVPERPMVLVVVLPGEGILLEQPFDTSDAPNSNAPSNALNLGTVTVSDTRLQRENLHDHQHEDGNQGGQLVAQPHLPKLIVRTIDSKGTPVPNTWVRFYDRNSQRAGQKQEFEMVNKRTDESGVADFGVMPNSFGCLQLSPSNQEFAKCYTLISATMTECSQAKPPRANVQTEIKDGILTVTFTMTPHVDLEFNIVDDATNEIVFWSEIFYQDPTTNRWWQFGLVDGSQMQHNFIPISPQITRETIRISALGYETQVFRLPDELDRSQSIRRDIRLKPMPDVELKVLLPDGTPAEKAKLTFHYPNELDCLQVHEAHSDAQGIVTTKFPPNADIGLLRLEHTGGTAELAMTELLDDVKRAPGEVIQRSIQLTKSKKQNNAVIEKAVTSGDHTEKPASWIPGRPQKTTVSGGSFSILDDHSVRLEGNVTWQEATTHFAFDQPTTVDELRLELLPVDSPSGPQLGRGGEELILSEVTARLEKQTGKPTIHEFSSCISLLNPEDELTIHCIDFLSDTGWIVPALPADAEAHSLVLRFDEPVTLQPDERLVLSVDSGGTQKFAVLNRIRFSFHQAATETGTVVLHAIDADTGEPIRDVTFVKENAVREDWATPVGSSGADGTVRIKTRPLPGYFFSILPMPQGYKVTSLDEVPAHVEVGRPR